MNDKKLSVTLVCVHSRTKKPDTPTLSSYHMTRTSTATSKKSDVPALSSPATSARLNLSTTQIEDLSKAGDRLEAKRGRFGSSDIGTLRSLFSSGVGLELKWRDLEHRSKHEMIQQSKS